MKKSNKIIIIGFGSVGQRHYRNLKKLGYKNLYIYDIDKLRVANYKLRVVKLDLKTLKDFEIAFICSPSYLHIKHAILAARAGCYLFIEKPLSHSLKDIDKLHKICQQKKLINMVACNVRFISGIQFIKKYLDKNRLGKIYSINHEGGFYLPFWRPKEDYRFNYAAKKSTGGGIILDGIHEFDLMFWLNDFNHAEDYKFIYNKVSQLQIETEDICLATFKFKNKILGSVRCDYLQQVYSRNLKIIGEKGNLEWEFISNTVYLKNKKGVKKLFEIKNWNLNQMYIDEVKYFMDCVKNKKKTFNDIKKAKEVLKYCIKK